MIGIIMQFGGKFILADKNDFLNTFAVRMTRSELIAYADEHGIRIARN